MMKRTTAVILSALMALGAMSGCQQEEPEATGVVNPVKSCTAEEIQELGYGFNLPESAEDVSYSIINVDENSKIAQVSFTADGVEYNHRMTAANEISDISGVYLNKTEDADAEVEYCPAKIAVEDGSGKVYWYDVVPGLLYSLSVKEGAEEEMLLTMAEEVFVPAQGEVG